jgi:hypothetical protein
VQIDITIPSCTLELQVDILLFDKKMESASLVANFMCELDWASGCPDSWLSIVSGCVYVGLQG